MLRVCAYFLLSFLISTSNFADSLSLTLQNTSLADAIRFIAKAIHQNVVISAKVTGMTSIQLKNVSANEALESLLIANGLVKWPMGDVWFIAPEAEVFDRQQAMLKWQKLQNETAPLMMQFWRIRYGKAEDLLQMLRDKQNAFLSKRGMIRVDERTNTIWLEDTEANVKKMTQLIARLDVPVQQIKIETRLASVDSDFERELGIIYTSKGSKSGENATDGRYSLAVAKLADGSLLDVKLAALENSGHAVLISSPKLFTANRQLASIEAGEEVPYQEVSESGGTAVAFKKAVLGLKVTPQLLPGNKVLLQLQINQDRPSNKLVLGMPTIRTRQIMTHVLLKSGQTIVLGGIYETNQEDGERAVPWLSHIPWIGELFIDRSIRLNKRELLIFVTPTVMRSPNDEIMYENTAK